MPPLHFVPGGERDDRRVSTAQCVREGSAMLGEHHPAAAAKAQGQGPGLQEGEQGSSAGE